MFYKVLLDYTFILAKISILIELTNFGQFNLKIINYKILLIA
jgi:hypothetical protein